MTTHYDAIVIGAGAMGSAAAYYLSRAGQKVLLIEQFELDHKMGSSYGYSRIIRYAYDHTIYIQMAHAVYPLWRALEAESGDNLMEITGGLDFGKADNPRLLATRDAMTAMNIPFETLTPAQVRDRFPVIHLDEDMFALYQPDAGFLRASLCVKAHVRLAQKNGAELRENCKVQQIIPQADGVTVETAQGTFTASRLVLTGGSWTSDLLASAGLKLPLQPTREPLVFFETGGNPDFSSAKMPSTICWGETHFYSIPEVDGTGFKCARHCGDEHVHPDTVNRTVDQAYIDSVRGHVRQYFPILADSPVQEARVCIYTMTPDEDFIIDRHPNYPHIAIGAGFSGHGFKFSTLIGKLLAELASGQQPDLDLSRFSVSRFG